MNCVSSAFTDTDFIGIGVLIFYKPSPFPQMYWHPTFPLHYSLNIPPQWGKGAMKM